MTEAHNQQENAAVPDKKLKLYIYGSCQSDQYYHPRGQSQSKRPICLSDIENFNIEDQEADPSDPPKIIPNPLYKQEILKIACGALHTIAVTIEGNVFTFGCNDQGALGRQGLEKIPIKVQLEDPIDLISAGDNHSVFANSVIGSIYFTGNYKYMRGQSMAERIRTPIRYELGQLDSRLKNQPIKKVVSGSNHSAVLAGGKVFIRGEPEAHTVGRRINQRNKVRNSLSFDGLGLNHVEDLWCGGYHSVAKVKKGNQWHYYVWGLNKHGQLGLRNYDDTPYPTELTKFKGMNFVDVAAGTNFTILLSQDSELYGCGQNDDGQLGLGQNYIYEDSEQESQLQVQIENKMNLKENQQEIEHIENKEEVKAKEEIKEKPEEEKKPITQQRENKPENQQLELSIKPTHQPMEIEIKPVPQQNQKKEEGQGKIQEKPEYIASGQVLEAEDKAEQESPIKRMKEENIYIKSFKKIHVQEKLTRISAGSEFCFGWNQNSLYSWGFGSNFVLLTGQQDDELVPFKVKSKILNQHAIFDLAAGAQHVAYLSYPTSQQKPAPKLSETALENSRIAKQKLSKKRRS